MTGARRKPQPPKITIRIREGDLSIIISALALSISIAERVSDLKPGTTRGAIELKDNLATILDMHRRKQSSLYAD